MSERRPAMVIDVLILDFYPSLNALICIADDMTRMKLNHDFE